MKTLLSAIGPHRGRPRKFTGPSRAVTLTLPEEILDALHALDHDLSRAVVRVAQPEMAKRRHSPAEVAPFGRRGVIVVTPTRTLEERTGVVLVPLSDGRALISFDESMSIARLELRLQDALEDHGLPAEDARVFESIRNILKDARRSGRVAVQQRNIIVLESNRAARSPDHAGARARRRPIT